MSGTPPMRRVLRRRESPAPSVAAAAALALLALAIALVPTAAAPVPTVTTQDARVSRVCPTTGAGAQVGTGSAGTGLAQAALTAPTKLVPAASTGVFAVGKEPVRLSAPLGTAFWGVAAATAAAPEQGFSLAACLQPRADFWFAGVRSGPSASTELVLVNLDATEANVNLSVYGADGPVATPGGRGVVVAGLSSRVLSLGPLVTAQDPVTVQVTASPGRVAAFVRQRLFQGTNAAGSGWLTAGAEPSSTVVVPTVPGGAGARTLVIGNPSERTAQVKVEVLGSDGAYSPVGVESVDVPAGTTRAFGLDKALNGQPAALRLTSSRPVVAAVEARTAGDWETVVGADGVGTSAVVATVPLEAGTAAAVTLANPAASAAHVDLTISESSGRQLAARTVDLGPGASLTVSPPAGASAAVVRVRSSKPDIRVGVAVSGTVAHVPVVAALALTDATVVVPPIALTPDPRLGS